jgi:hypothetical protein
METTQAVFLFPRAVRAQVLEQHVGLRRLLQEALDASTRGLTDPDDPAALGDVVLELRQRMVAHLLFEERSLLPVLAEVDLWGPERTQALREEHARQRAELDTLVEGMQSEWDVERTALALRSLATDLLIDMAEEERVSLDPRLLGDEILSPGGAGSRDI